MFMIMSIRSFKHGPFFFGGGGGGGDTFLYSSVCDGGTHCRFDSGQCNGN